MPARNIVPKPVQKPHPPLWVACSNRETIKLAAQARHRRAHLRLRRSGRGQAVGRRLLPDHQGGVRADRPRGERQHRHGDRLLAAPGRGRGAPARPGRLPLLQFALGHHYGFGEHMPGPHRHLGASSRRRARRWRTPIGRGIGTPQQLREHLRDFQDAGVDQVVFIQQGGRNKHEHICEALELFAAEVMPEFKEREAERVAKKAEDLAPFIEAAMKRKSPEAAGRRRDSDHHRPGAQDRRRDRPHSPRGRLAMDSRTTTSVRSAKGWRRQAISR